MRQSLRTALLVTAVAVLAAASSRAGEIVIPIAVNQTIQGLTYTTRVWVANPSNAAQTFTGAFYAAGADGTTAPGSTGPQHVSAGAMLVYSSVAEPGATGMLAVRGPAALEVTAALETRSGTRLLGTTTVPSITADDAFGPQAVGHLAGLERVGVASVSDFYLYNLDGAAAQCSVKLFQAAGSQIGGTVQLALQPRQRRDFVDALGLVGQVQASDVRIEVRCNHRFWLAGLVRRLDAPATLILPTSDLAKEALGGTPPPPPPPPPTDGTVSFAVPGLFLNAKANAAYRSYELPTTAGVSFKKAVVEFDLRIGKFGSGNFTGVHAFRRPHPSKSERVLYYGLQINNFKARTILDLGEDDQLAKGTEKWESGHTYHLRFTYDVARRSITLDVSENGSHLETVSGEAHNFDLSNDGQPLVVDFGMLGVGGDGGYVPPIGWQYSDLKVLLTP